MLNKNQGLAVKFGALDLKFELIKNRYNKCLIPIGFFQTVDTQRLLKSIN